MKRIAIWLAATFSVLVLLFGYRTSTSGALSTTAQTPVTGSSTQEASPSSGSDSGSGSSASGSAGSGSGPGAGSGGSGSGGSGTGGTQGSTQKLTGSAVATQWGPVQVEITTQNGSIRSVSVIQYPHTNSHDLEVNGYALPILIKETINAQSTQIDMVSGATLTSVGYLQSLQSALDQEGS